MTTALTVYYSLEASSTSASANKLYVVGGTPGNNPTYTLLGVATGYGEVPSDGTALAWAAAGSIGNPSGMGFFLDPAQLDLTNQDIVAGSWSAAVRLVSATGTGGTLAGSFGCSIYARAYKYNTVSATYTLITTMSITGQTVTSTLTTFTATSTTTHDTSFTANDRLYVDIWLNVTSNANGSTENIRLNRQSTDTVGRTGDPAAAITTPGYNADALASVTEQAPTYTETLAINTVTTLTEKPALGSETVYIGKLVIEQAPTYTESVQAYGVSISAPDAQMMTDDLDDEYDRITNSAAFSLIDYVSHVYYGNNTLDKVQQGELDVVMLGSDVDDLIELNTRNDVTSFLLPLVYPATVKQDTPVAYFKLNETVGSVFVADFINSYTSNAISVTFGQAGIILNSLDTAALFNGTSSYIFLPPELTTTGWNAITLETWINPTNTSGGPIIANSSTLGFHFHLNATNTLTFAVATNAITTSATLTSGTWYHVCATWNGTTATIYINGVQQAQGAIAGPIPATGNVINIAKNPSTGAFLACTLSQVNLCNLCVTPARVLIHYQAGATGFDCGNNEMG